VLLAIGRSPELTRTARRPTLAAPTTDAEIDRVLELLPAAVRRPREMMAALERRDATPAVVARLEWGAVAPDF
jgi:cysteine sulfinate desulfinase/cysteine desulfurase-like protein